MRTVPVLFAAAALGAAAFCAAPDARALGPIGLELGGQAGVGSNPFSSSPNPLGFGLGARGGITIVGLYGGVSLMYYFGGSESATGPGGTSVSLSEHSFMYGIDVGYGVSLLDLLTVRAQVGFGNFTLSSSGGAQIGGVSGGASQSNSNVYLQPGVMAMLSLGTLFVGADANILVLPGITDSSGQSSTDTAVTVHGQIGVKY